MDAKEATQKERFHDERYRKVCQARDQKQIELDEASARIESLQAENQYIVKNLDRTQFETQEKLHEIHEMLDPVGSIHSVSKSFDHTVDLVR